jgi:hypothetical protein
MSLVIDGRAFQSCYQSLDSIAICSIHLYFSNSEIPATFCWPDLYIWTIHKRRRRKFLNVFKHPDLLQSRLKIEEAPYAVAHVATIKAPKFVIRNLDVENALSLENSLE